MSPHTPILSVPSPAHHQVSGPHDLIGLPIYGQEMPSPMTVERREVEGIGKRHASTHWLYPWLSVPWPTCDGEEDDLDNSHRCNRATESPQPKTASHTLALPSLQSSTAIQSQIAYPHINSTQPTYHPVMVVASMEPEPDAERIRGGGIKCCGFTIAGPQGTKQGIQISPSHPNGQSQMGPTASTPNQLDPAPPMREPISRPMTPSQGASRSRAASHSSPKSGPGAPTGSRSRRPSQAQAANGAKEPSQRVPRSRTPSQTAESRPRTQSGAKEPRSRAGSMSQSRSRANSRAGQVDSNRPRLLPSTAPTLPPVPSPVTPINLGYP